MFGFLRSKKTTPPHLGVELGLEKFVAVMLDSEHHILSRQEQDPPEQDHQLEECIRSLLANISVKDCHLVVSLTQDYHISAVDLPDLTPEAIRTKASSYLPYDAEDATFSWQPLGEKRALVVAYPRELLELLSRIFISLNPLSLYFEAPEVAQVRLLEDAGLPGGLISASGDTLMGTMASETDVLIIRQNRSLLGLEHFCTIVLDTWKARGQKEPRHLLTDARQDYMERITGLECLELPKDCVPIYLAQSTPGPHRYNPIPN